MGKQTAATISRLTYPAQHSKQIILSTMSSRLIATQACALGHYRQTS